jgi:hypothetical protein
MTIADDGKVGIGAPNPLVGLHVGSVVDATLGDGTGTFMIGNQDGMNLIIDDNEIMARNDAGESTLYLQAYGGDVVIHNSQPGSKVVVKDSGNVGIGTDTPASKLEVDGVIHSTTGGVKFPDGTTQTTAASGSTGSILAGTFKNLIVKSNTTNPDYEVDITVDAISLDNAGSIEVRTNLNLTADLSSSLANGLDTGSEANSTWYYLWVIYDGATDAALLSLSPTAPTMPAGYTHKALVSAVWNDGSGDLRNFYQVGKHVQHSTTTFLDFVSTSATQVNLDDYTPPIAPMADILFGCVWNAQNGQRECYAYTDSSMVLRTARVVARWDAGYLISEKVRTRQPMATAQKMWARINASGVTARIEPMGFWMP